MQGNRVDQTRSRWLSTIRVRLFSAFGFAAALTIVSSTIAFYEFTVIGATTHEYSVPRLAGDGCVAAARRGGRQPSFRGSTLDGRKGR